MLYLAIDQHRKQLTVEDRNENGDVTVKRQVSTKWDSVRAFLEDYARRAEAEGGFVVILEVCGFNHWLVKMLGEYGCREVILIQPEKRSKRKTDRRDASALATLLWVNRDRLLSGKPVHGLRRVEWPTEQDAADRQLTILRQRLGQLRTRTINRVKHLLRKHNIEQECPTKGLDTIKGRNWLTTVALGPMDRAGDGSGVESVEAVGRADRDTGPADPQASGGERNSSCHRDHPRLRSLQQPDVGFANRLDRSFPTAGQFGQLLGSDAGLPQLRRGDGSAGLNHQARQCPGTIHFGATGIACSAA